MIKATIKNLFISLICGLLLTACDGEKDSKLQAYLSDIKKVAANAQKNVAPKTFELPTPVTYPPNSLPGALNGNAQIKKSSTNPLLNYPVNSLHFVGTITQDNQVAAYIMTPDKMVYPVKVGDIIGSDKARILKIDATHIEISVLVTPPGKPATEQVVNLQLRE